jgi:hypothetical protein
MLKYIKINQGGQNIADHNALTVLQITENDYSESHSCSRIMIFINL